MTQQPISPAAYASLVQTILMPAVSALTGQGGAAKAESVLNTILSMSPRDAPEMMFAGQMMLFNELTADGAKDVLTGMVDTLKLRAQSNIVAMNRALQQNAKAFMKLKDRPGGWRDDAPGETTEAAA